LESTMGEQQNSRGGHSEKAEDLLNGADCQTAASKDLGALPAEAQERSLPGEEAPETSIRQ
jgi:hypothetical protein